MAAWRYITVQPNLYSRLEGRISCTRCGQELIVGERAWAHMCPRKQESYTEYFCSLCFKKLWI